MKITPTILFLFLALACSAADPRQEQDLDPPEDGLETDGAGATDGEYGGGSDGHSDGGYPIAPTPSSGGEAGTDYAAGGTAPLGSGGTSEGTGSGPNPGTGGSPNPGTGGSSNPGTGGATAWQSNYTFTYYGQSDCPQYGASDGFSIDAGTCSGEVSLTEDVRSYYAAPGDLSSIWAGAPCDNANPPNCDDQDNCGLCVEIKCDPSGPYYLPSDPYKDPHGDFCRTDQSVVVKIVDACPANHSNNDYWCTAARPDHVDISCSAFRALTIDESNGGRVISQIGSINGQVRIVDCSVGLGVHGL